MSERLRGRAGQAQRNRRLALHPLCAHCEAEGVTKPTDEIDHILPLAEGGTDDDENTQGLCFAHHEAKSAAEGSAQTGAASHPDWLKPSAIPLTIVCGPPASGKTTYITANAKSGDTVIEIDDIRTAIDPTWQRWSGDMPRALRVASIRRRNAILGTLSRMTHGRAWYSVSAPTAAERQWWMDTLGGAVVLLDPGVKECKRRATERGTPGAVAGIDLWHRKASRPWSARTERKPVIGNDGWPVEA